jgi:hypothetical protein
MRISIVKHSDGTASIYFEGVSHYNDLDLILGLLQQENECEILSNKRYLDARDAKLQWHDVRFGAEHEVLLGNYLRVENPQDVPVLEQLANNVIASIQERLRQIQHNE